MVRAPCGRLCRTDTPAHPTLAADAWFAGKRGWPFALAVIPWHWLYYGYNGLSFAVGLGAHLLDRRNASHPRLPADPAAIDASPPADAESAGA